ncbi:hypothetical protein G3I76_15685 [Streptomyces sp. SID11233]|nr:hypothetical protein [Streptomyces sp. SID11233]
MHEAQWALAMAEQGLFKKTGAPKVAKGDVMRQVIRRSGWGMPSAERGVAYGHLDAARVRGQLQGACPAAVTQGGGDECRDDQDHGVAGLGCNRRQEPVEEVPGARARRRRTSRSGGLRR